VPLPPGVTLKQIDGGPTWYADNGFNAAWDNPAFFPLGQDYCFYPVNSTTTFKALGLNFTHRVTSDTDLSVLRAAGIYVIQGVGDTPTNTGSETIGWHLEEPSSWTDIQSQAGVAFTRGLAGRFLQCSFTWNQLFYGTISGAPGDSTMPFVMDSPISTAGNAHLNIPGDDIYWFAGSTVTDGGGPPYYGQNIYNTASLLTADQCARGPHYGDMIDKMRTWLSTYPAPIISAYIETDDGLVGAGSRQITPPEWNWAMWSSIIHGARGIICFSTTSNFSDGSTFGFQTSVQAGQSISMYNQAIATHTRITSLAPVINSPFAQGYFTVTPPPVILNGATPDSGIDAMAKYYTSGGSLANGYYIFATTRASETATNIAATFTTADLYTGPVTVVGESRTVTAVRGVFSDTFATGATVHVYQVPLVSWTLVNSDNPVRWTSDSFTYTFPSGAPTAGQLDIIGIDLSGSGALTVPSGWTLVGPTATTGGGNCNQYLLWKIAGSSASATVALNSTMNPAADEAILCWARYSATGTITADGTGVTNVGNSDVATSPAVSLSLTGANELVVAYLGCFNGTALAGLSWSSGYSTIASGADPGFGGVTDAMGANPAASSTQSPVVTWTSGNLNSQAILVQAFQVSGAASSGALMAASII
jgi:hypothetical protein